MMGQQLDLLDLLQAVEAPCPALNDSAAQPIMLHRIDPVRNMQRYYSLTIERDLFQHYALVRAWGRIGRSGQSRTTPYVTAHEAVSAMGRQAQAKARRGYSPTPKVKP